MMEPRKKMKSGFARWKHDQRGATLTEFGLVVPVLCVLVMGIFDVAHTQYTSSLVNGAMQKAGRNLTLESAGAQESTIDQKVINQVTTVVPPTAIVELQKLSHFDFRDIGEVEEFTDTNGDGTCNFGEPFIDVNDNGTWDQNRGEEGIGGARDAVLYTAVVTYPRLFPMGGLIGMPDEVRLSASTVLRNQPYDEQK